MSKPLIIDVHGHYTTAPKALEEWRNKQIAAINDPVNRPKPSELRISDDELRESIETNQLAKMEHYIRKQALQVTFRDELNATEHQEEVTNTSEAKKMALYLFWNVKADLERPFLIADDVADFLPPGEAEEAFAIFDQNGNGRVTLQECINIVLGIFAARCDLALSLKDTRSVIGKLESVIGVVVHIIFVFLYLIVFQVDVVKTYLALSSLVLAFSFVFQNSIRTVSGSQRVAFFLFFLSAIICLS